MFAEYFDEFFQITATDQVRRGEDTIQESRVKLNFRTVADRATVIPKDTIAVVVPYRRAAKLIERIKNARRIDYRVLRRLQRYMVNLRRGDDQQRRPKMLFEQLWSAGMLTQLRPDLDLLVVDASCYDPQRGVVFKERSPEDFVQ